MAKMYSTNSPIAKQCKTYLRGTLLRIYSHHLERESLKDSEYIRDVIRKDLQARYHMTETGIVKIPKKV